MRFDCKEKVAVLNKYKSIVTQISRMDTIQAAKLKYVSITNNSVSLKPEILKVDISTVEKLIISAENVYDKILQGFLKTKQESKKYLNKSIDRIVSQGMEELEDEVAGKSIRTLVMNHP